MEIVVILLIIMFVTKAYFSFECIDFFGLNMIDILYISSKLNFFGGNKILKVHKRQFTDSMDFYLQKFE